MPALGRLRQENHSRSRLVSSTEQDFVLKTQHNKIPIWNGKYIINTYIRSLNKKSMSHTSENCMRILRLTSTSECSSEVSSLQTTALCASPSLGWHSLATSTAHEQKPPECQTGLGGSGEWSSPSAEICKFQGQVRAGLLQPLWHQTNTLETK